MFSKEDQRVFSESLKNICIGSVLVHCRYISDAFADDFAKKLSKKKQKKSDEILVVGCFDLNSKFISSPEM